jgi:RES domain-containing protein
VADHIKDAGPIDEILFRAAGPDFTGPVDIVSGIGALTKDGGGRWNPPGVMRALYLSRKPETALAESLAGTRRRGIPDEKALPKANVAIYVKCERVLDLTQTVLAATLPVPLANLLSEDWFALNDRGREAAAQALGRAVCGQRLQGLLVPSRAELGGVNLMLLIDNLSKSCVIKLLKEEKLKKLGK